MTGGGGARSEMAIRCWRCGETVPSLPQPWPRRAECAHCHCDLHVCKMCRHFTPHLLDRCDEPLAEHPRELERANFCDYFSAKTTAARDTGKRDAARAQLDSLFGGATADGASGGDGTDTARTRLEALFTNKGQPKKNDD